MEQKKGIAARVGALRVGAALAASVLAAAALLPGRAPAEESAAAPVLRPQTLEAFQRYVTLTDKRNESELKQGEPFLWVEGLREPDKEKTYEQLRQGEIKIERSETRDGGARIPCPGGMIHHWLGVVFIAGTNLGRVLSVLQDYDHHAEYYSPDVEGSKTELHDGDHFRVFLRFRRHKVITVVLDTEHDVRYFRDSDLREHSRSSAVRIAEVQNAGKAAEREKPPGDDGGYLWGMETWWRMEERDGGVYVQSEVVSLTRDIPTGLGWLIGPFVTSIPKETLTFTLEATRKEVKKGK